MTNQNKDRIQLAINALEYLAYWQKKDGSAVVNEVAEVGLKALRALQSQPAAAQSPLPADKQAALDDFKFLETYLHQIGSWEIVSDKIMSIKAALTAPQPVADLEGLKRAVDRHFWALWNKDQDSGKKFSIYAGLNTSVIEEIIDHLHATGRMNTAQQAAEIKALKAAVRDLDGALSEMRKEYRYVNKHYIQEKHAATIEAAKEG